MKYKVGDKVKIIDNTYNHDFKIGEIVTITLVNEKDNDYRANGKEDFWFVKDEEIELVQENKFNYWRNICEIQAEQTAKGISKYGYPLEQNTWLDINERLRYLQEELVDALMYIEHIKTLLGGENENR